MPALNLVIPRNERLLAQLADQYQNANCRGDILLRLQDCDTRMKVKPPYEGGVDQWPPNGFSEYSQPPRIDWLPESVITLKSCPDMITKSFARFNDAAASALGVPLTAEEKTKFIESEASRLDMLPRRALWQLENEYMNAKLDQLIYENLFEGLFQPLFPARYVFSPNTCVYDQHTVPDFGLDASPGGQNAGSVLRFLYLETLDVCQEIQDLAASGDTLSSKEGVSVWSGANVSDPKGAKARDIIRWILHAARQSYSIEEGKVNRLKLSDGWNNIWFHLDQDTLFVSPTMCLTRLDYEGQTAPVGLVHALFSFAFEGGTELSEYMHRRQKRARVSTPTYW